MASYVIPDLYQRYKSGTKKVVQWLAETAGTECIGITSSPHSATIQLTAKNLMQLAVHISNRAKPNRAPPEHLEVNISILIHVITGRRECSLWYRKKAELLGQKDASHNHFIEVLSTILGHLKHAREQSLSSPKKKGKGKGKGKDNKNSKDCGNDFANIFERLDIEEPADSLQNDASAQHSASHAPAAPARPQFELEAQDEDMNFALWCLLEDCHKIRLFLRRPWDAYTEGELSLSTVSEVTNNAFIIIRLAVEQFAARFPHLANFHSIAEYLQFDLSTNGKQLETFSCNGVGDTGLSSDGCQNPADILCIPAYISLTLARMVNDPANSMSHEEFRDTLRYAEESHRFAYNLLEVVEVCRLLGWQLDDWLRIGTMDAFFSDFMPHTRADSSLPLYAVIESQIYMDIVDTIGYTEGTESRCLEDIQRQIDMGILDQKIAHRIEGALVTPFHTRTGRFAPSGRYRSLPAFTPLFCHLPVLCGWFVGYLDLPNSTDSIETCNNAFIVLAVAHLYMACRDTGLVGAWPDMDFALETQGLARLKLWTPAAGARSLDTAARHYDQALGITVQQQVGRNKLQRLVRIPLPSFSQVTKTAARFEPVSAYSKSMLEARDSKGGTDKDPRQLSHRALYRMTARLVESPTSQVNDEIRTQWEQCKTLTPEQLLSVLQSSLVADEMQQSFDFRSLFRVCANILLSVKSGAHDEIVQMRANDGLGEEYHGYEIASDILWNAARAPNHSPRFLKAYSLLGGFAHVLQAHIDKGGSGLLRKAEGRIKMLRCGGGGTGLIDEHMAAEGETACDGMKLTMHGKTVGIRPMQLSPEQQLSWDEMVASKGETEQPESASEMRAAWERHVLIGYGGKAMESGDHGDEGGWLPRGLFEGHDSLMAEAAEFLATQGAR
ncbi:hypothetical protein LTR49_014133 [Elasticomyces elasticus]|nr:hypothetical protein LTR49_014133 [Elasticomyces elasticus]